MFDYFEGGSAAGASAQGGDDYRQTYVFQVLVEAFYRIFGGETPGDDISAAAASRKPISAEKNELSARTARSCVGVGYYVPKPVTEGAAYAARHSRAGGSDTDKKHGGSVAHLKNLPKIPSRMDFSS
jgi:hypothetical protein